MKTEVRPIPLEDRRKAHPLEDRRKTHPLENRRKALLFENRRIFRAKGRPILLDSRIGKLVLLEKKSKAHPYNT